MEEDSPSDIESKATKSKAGRPKGTKDDPRILRDRKTVKILELASKEIMPVDIANAVNLPISTVTRTIEKFKPIFKQLENVRDYRENKADILSAGQLAALNSAFSGNKLDKSSFLSTLMGFEILNKAERLDLGKSTEIHSHGIFGKVNVTMDQKEDWIDVTPGND